MSTLSSTSTDAEVWAAYDDNAPYEEDDSATMAAAFITACRIIARRQLKRTHHGQRQMEWEPTVIQEALQHARIWLAHKNATGGGVIHPSFEDFR